MTKYYYYYYLLCVSNCVGPPEQKDKAEPFDVAEVMQEMSREQVQTLWGKLAALLEDILQELPPERWGDGREEGTEVEAAADPVSLALMQFGLLLLFLFVLDFFFLCYIASCVFF